MRDCTYSAIPTTERPSSEELKALDLPTATVHEALGRVGALPSAIRPLHTSMRLCGPAVTVSCPAGDNLRIHHAIYLAQPGDILVVDVNGAHEYGYWGEILAVAATVRSLGGLVIDGGVRDSERLIEIGFPIFSRGLCIRGTEKDPSRGTINRPIRIGDTEIFSGDPVIGDADGVVIVPRHRSKETAIAAIAREAKERDIIDRLRSGATTPEIYGLASLD